MTLQVIYFQAPTASTWSLKVINAILLLTNSTFSTDKQGFVFFRTIWMTIIVNFLNVNSTWEWSSSLGGTLSWWYLRIHLFDWFQAFRCYKAVHTQSQVITHNDHLQNPPGPERQINGHPVTANTWLSYRETSLNIFQYVPKFICLLPWNAHASIIQLSIR